MESQDHKEHLVNPDLPVKSEMRDQRDYSEMKELKDRKDLKDLKDHLVKMVYPAEMVPEETQEALVT